MPIIELKEIRKKCKGRGSRLRRYGLSSRSRRQSGRLGKAVSYTVLEGLGRHLWGTLRNHVVPMWEGIDFSLSRVICYPYLDG
jgi:hypothetical protein